MTAPDPSPYAAPGDLVTAADVAEWLRDHAVEWRAYARAHPEAGAMMVRLDYGGAMALDGALEDLRERLDRERRQACRRGARYHWRRVCVLVRWTRTVHGAQWAWDDCGESVARSISRALAFRAAARQP